MSGGLPGRPRAPGWPGLLLALLLLAACPAAMPADTANPADKAAIAAAEPQGFWTGPVNSPVPHTLAGGKVIHTGALQRLLQAEHPVLVDVSNAPHRPENLPPSSTWLPVPHPALPGAVWIPGAGMGEPPTGVDSFYRERLAALTGNDLSRPLVIYCHKRCWLSWNGAKRAIGYGYRNVYWFPDGIEGWRAAKLPTQTVEPQAAP